MLPPNPNTFANSPLDRAAHRRRDEAWLRDAMAGAAARVALMHQGQPMLDAAGAVWLGGAALGAAGEGAMVVFLGVDGAGAPHFAIEPDEAFDIAQSPLAGLGEFADMRAAAMRLPAHEASMLGCAKSLFEWHRRHRFCANCGAPSRVVEAGWKRECDQCKAEHFPRTDPVVIMVLVIGEKCLLGRQKRFPRGMYSALAGFVEPGEAIEEAVARETLEEAGLKVTRVRYHSTQPWPFPSSLMIGCIADVADDREEIDEEELESGRWFTRAEARLMIEGKHPECACPPAIAIAHHIIKAWAFEA
jgi:NAD+ diphosphatase